MTTMDTATARFDVRSADGTTIAVWVEGDGPALVMVHGSTQDHTVSAALVGELRAGVTTYAVDRRGFGASGDHQEYSLERVTEDVAAVVGEVAARTGWPGRPVGTLLRREQRDGCGHPHHRGRSPSSLRAQPRPRLPAWLDRDVRDDGGRG